MTPSDRRVAWAVGGLVTAAAVGVATWLVWPSPAAAAPSSRKAQVRQLGERVEALGVLPGFADFLVASAFIESRFNPNAGSDEVNNAARGWFGMRPRSAFNFKNGLTALATSHPNLIKDPAWAVATAADYARRILPFADPGQVVTGEDLRRGWKFPGNIADSKVSDAGKAKSRKQFQSAATRTGVPLSMLTRPMVLGDWPGIVPLVESLGGSLP